MNLKLNKSIKVIADSGYQGLNKIYKNSRTPTKKKKGKFLTKWQKLYNKLLSRKRMLVENVIGKIKIFKIVADRYRNRRKRFCLRFNLIAGIYNYEV
jgi:IS5 family transposase